jgi:co-chaperonin GroES (HSP10)|tara:strand:- start:1101 stop:1685 length:585 start_codon:yes stop_codon:yes gene_type:complete
MKTFNLFVVELEKTIDDTITTSSGLELYVDNRFNEFENRITEGPVVAVPFKYNTGVKPGDTLYFHHLVVINEGQPLTGDDNHYLVRYDEDHAINNQAIAFKDISTGDIHPLAGWSLLEAIEEEVVQESELIEVVKLDENLPTRGRVAFTSSGIEEVGLKVGDVVGFKENRDYRITIDGKEYYRTRVEDLMYVEA